MSDTRKERDSMGELAVPADALYGASTQRAVGNFPISGQRLEPTLIHAMGWIKEAAAHANAATGGLPEDLGRAIADAASAVAELIERSLALVTSLVPLIGYDKAAAIAKEAMESGRTIRELCAERMSEFGITPEQLEHALDPAAMAGE